MAIVKKDQTVTTVEIYKAPFFTCNSSKALYKASRATHTCMRSDLVHAYRRIDCWKAVTPRQRPEQTSPVSGPAERWEWWAWRRVREMSIIPTVSAPEESRKSLTSLQTGVFPKTTWRPWKKFSPIIITLSPPLVQPSLGEIALIIGGAVGTTEISKVGNKVFWRDSRLYLLKHMDYFSYSFSPSLTVNYFKPTWIVVTSVYMRHSSLTLSILFV